MTTPNRIRVAAFCPYLGSTHDQATNAAETVDADPEGGATGHRGREGGLVGSRNTGSIFEWDSHFRTLRIHNSHTLEAVVATEAARDAARNMADL